MGSRVAGATPQNFEPAINAHAIFEEQCKFGGDYLELGEPHARLPQPERVAPVLRLGCRTDFTDQNVTFAEFGPGLRQTRRIHGAVDAAAGGVKTRVMKSLLHSARHAKHFLDGRVSGERLQESVLY